MFAYCNDNPVNVLDNNGCLGVFQYQNYSFTDEGVGVVDTGVGGGLLIYLFLIIKSALNGGDHHHILHGTNGRHEDGWRRFGIDPNDPDDNNWPKLLPILEETYRQGKEEMAKMVNNGEGKVIYYIRVFEEVGVRVWLKIWQAAETEISKLSDAWTDIF